MMLSLCWKQRRIVTHAAGNDSKDADYRRYFPNPVYIDDKKKAANVLTVGASGDEKWWPLASFSNFAVKTK